MWGCFFVGFFFGVFVCLFSLIGHLEVEDIKTLKPSGYPVTCFKQGDNMHCMPDWIINKDMEE